MSGLFSPADLAELRAFNSETHSDECLITRPTGRVFNETTLAEEPGEPTEIYSGPCQFKESDTAVMQVIGEGQVAMQMIDVYIDYDAPRIRRGDIVTVVTSEEPDLNGRDLVVLNTRLQTQPRGRKLTCEFAEASSLFDPSE